jgi:hypothetical protein
VLAPVAQVNPAVQGSQLLAPAAAENVPATQGVASVLPASQ